MVNSRSSYVPGGRVFGITTGHEPDARAPAGTCEQLTYIHATNAVSAEPGTYKPIQSLVVGLPIPLHVAVTLLPGVSVVGLAVMVAGGPNVAVTDRFCVMLTTQAPLPAQKPPQEVKFPLVTDSVTDVPELKLATQVPAAQLLMPAGVLLTVPAPVTVTESV